MSAMSVFLEGQILGQLFGTTTTLARPSVVAIALTTAAINPTMTGANLPEVSSSGTGYVRQSIAPGSGWTLSSNTITNTAAVSFGQASASYGTVVGIALVDSSTANSGDLLFFGTLATPTLVSTGSTLSFAPAEISLELS
jgi:hypothetical protein